jgi:predicted nucleic acid-binding protein
MILVDSDVLIAHLRGMEAARHWLGSARARVGQRLAVSVVTITEITGGMRSSERREVARLLTSLQPYPVNELVAHRGGEFMRRYRRSHTGIGLGDYLVAATADVAGLELATLNVKHFPMFDGLRPAFGQRER